VTDSRTQIVEIETFNLMVLRSVSTKGGIKKMQPSITMLLKTKGEKKYVFRLATKSLKKN